MRKLLLLAVIVLLAKQMMAQDMHYSQYYANPLYLNPAFTGAITHQRVAVNHRLQWPELPKAFANYSFSYDQNAPALNSGFGLLANVDRAGSASLQSASIAFNYSYTVAIQKAWVIKPALSFGYVSRSIDYTKLVFGDQIDFGIDGAPSQDPTIGQIDSNNFMDIGSGLLAYNKNTWIGLSAFHLNTPNHSLISGSSYLPVKWSVHAGMRFQLGNPAFKNVKKMSVSPSFIYRSQGSFDQLDLGASFHYSPVLFGLYYRGLPWEKNDANQLNHDAVVLLFGVKFEQFQFGYSFDSNISRLSTSTGGAHELSLVYHFQWPKNPNRVERSKRFLPCPAFIDELYN